MNERIKELVLKAYNNAGQGTPDEISLFMQVYSEKFAELIIRECAKTVEVYIHDSLFNGLYERGYNDGRNASASLIKQHFGVEE